MQRSTGHPAAPTANDFSRITSRYLVAAREWTHAHRDRAREALRQAVVGWSGCFDLTLWTWKGHKPFGGTAEKPGHGRQLRTRVDDYAQFLRDNAMKTFPKGQAACITLGRSRHRGRSDNECLARTGMLLDSDDCGGWDSARALLREVGLSFVGQMRSAKPKSHHLEIFFAEDWLPVPDARGDVKRWKDEVYCPRLGWVLGILSELGGLDYEPSWESEHASAKRVGYDPACDQLLQLNFIYTVRPDDPPGHIPHTDHFLAGALDIDKLLVGTEFKLLPSARLVMTRESFGSANRPRSNSVAPPQQQRPAAVDRYTLIRRLRSLHHPESRRLIALMLDGKSYAPLGERDHTLFRIACILACVAPGNDPGELAQLLQRSLLTMSRDPIASPNYVERKLKIAAEKICRAQRRWSPELSVYRSTARPSSHEDESTIVPGYDFREKIVNRY